MNSYDVAVGGGAAGLSAALVLARARRRVAVVDAGQPRNAPAAHMHGFLGSDGLPPAELLGPGAREVTGYGGELDRRAPSPPSPGPAARPRPPASPSPSRTARVTAPAASWSPPGWATSSRTSPACANDGAATCCTAPTATATRSATSPLGVLGGTPEAVAHAHLVRQWSDDVVFFADGADLTDDQRPAARGPWHRGRRRARRPARRRGRPARPASSSRPGRSSRRRVFVRPHSSPTTPCSPTSAARPERLGRRDRPAHQRPRRLGRRQRRQPPRPGHHRRRRRFHRSHRHQHRPRRGRHLRRCHPGSAHPVPRNLLVLARPSEGAGLVGDLRDDRGSGGNETDQPPRNAAHRPSRSPSPPLPTGHVMGVWPPASG